MNGKKILKFLLTLLGMTLIAQASHSLGAFLEMDYYRDPQYFPVWSKLMMPNAGPPPPSFMLYSFLFGLVGWFFFLAAYRLIQKGIPGQGSIAKGATYGIIVFLVGNLGGSLAMALLINLPYGLILMWALESLLIDLINGMWAAWATAQGTRGSS